MNRTSVAVLVRQQCWPGGSVTLVRGADDDLRLTREPHGHDPRGFSWPGPVVPAFTRGPLSPLPASWPALANRWQHFGRPRKQRSGGLELGPTRQSRWGGPAGLSDRSGAQAGFEPAVAADERKTFRRSTSATPAGGHSGSPRNSKNLSGPPLGIEPGERRHTTGHASHSAEAHVRAFRWSRRFGQRNAKGKRGRGPNGH